MPTARLPAGPARRSLPAALARAACCALPLAGCQTDSLATASTYPNDYRLRHPIALVYAPTDLDLFVGRNGGRSRPAAGAGPPAVRRRTTAPMAAGRCSMLVPVGPGGRRRFAGPRGRARRAGLGGRARGAGAGPDLFRARRAARLARPPQLHQAAGQGAAASAATGRQDLAARSASLEGWQNKPYPNLGCAYQTAHGRAGRRSDRPRPRPARRARSDVSRRMKVVRRRAQGRGSLDDMEDRSGRRRAATASEEATDEGRLLQFGQLTSTPTSAHRRAGAAHLDPGLLRDARRRRRRSRRPRRTGAWTRRMLKVQMGGAPAAVETSTAPRRRPT